MRTIASLIVLIASCAVAQPTTAPADAEAKYSADIAHRADGIIAAMTGLAADKTQAVHDVITARYRELRAWHDANEAKIKAKQDVEIVDASRKTLHAAFLAKLETMLTPEQIEVVKDKMSNGLVTASIKGYEDIVGSYLPNGFNDEQRAMIRRVMMEAREEAIDAGSAKEKATIVKKYRGRVNNELSRQGVDIDAAYKAWGAKQKAAKAAATQPAAR